MILLSDANILIDFASVGGLGPLVELGRLEVLDVVQAEVQGDPRVPALGPLGVRVVPVPPEWLPEAARFRRSGLSPPDLLCLYHCVSSGRVLLSNDGRLRKACAEHKVEVHGSLWVVLELNRLGICPPNTLCDWLQRWEDELKARLPLSELAQLRKTLGCAASQSPKR